MAKWPRVKLKKKKNMWVKKVVEALGDSWQGPTQLQFPPKYIENTFGLSKLLNSMRRLIIMTTIRVIHWETGLFSIEIIRATILFFREFWNFLWFLLYHNFVSENFSSPYMEKTCLVYKSHPPPLPQPSRMLFVSPWPSGLGYASPLPIRIWFDPVGRTEMSPSIWQNYFPQDRSSVPCFQER